MVLVVAFLIGSSGGDSAAKPTATASPPGPLRTTVPDLDQAAARICDPVMQAMPVTLDDGAGTTVSPLVVTPGGPSFLAWGDPLVTLQCGVARPTWLRDDVDYGDPQQITAPDGYGATWVVMGTGDRVTWTVIDRAVYFQAVLPKGDAPFLVDLSGVIGKALPQVCTQPVPGDKPDAKYCGSRP